LVDRTSGIEGTALRPLGLNQMTALEVPAPELVSIAHEVGCQHVVLFVQAEIPGTTIESISPSLVPETIERADATGVSVMRGDFFLIAEGQGVDVWRPGVDLAAQLGAPQIITVVTDPVEARAAESLSELCDLAGEYGMAVTVEFMGLMPGCPSLAAARRLVELVARPNLGIMMDPLHMVRTGATAQDLLGLPEGLITHAQICDGADLEPRTDYYPETFERIVPGKGVFPLVDLFAAIPLTVPVDIEVPSLAAQQQGIPARERARRAAAGARQILAQVAERAGGTD
jgi:sugar phosphate isomerase/epimerase